MNTQPFLQPHQVNFIRKRTNMLISAFYFAGDYRVLNASRESVVESILEQFTGLTADQQALLREAGSVRDKDELKLFMEKLEPYVIPFPTITGEEIRKLFPKVKKLVLPALGSMPYHTMSFLGWRDIANNNLYLVHHQNGKWVGTKCQYVLGSSKKAYQCTWCHQMRPGDEIALVTAKVKNRQIQDGYKTMGNHLCLDSRTCNAALTSLEEMEAFLASMKK